MNDFDTVRNDAIQLALAVVQQAKRTRMYHRVTRRLSLAVIRARDMQDLELACEELRKIYRDMLNEEKPHDTELRERVSNSPQSSRETSPGDSGEGMSGAEAVST